MLSLMVWISAHTGMSVPTYEPHVRFKDHETLWYMQHPNHPYDPATQKIGALYRNDFIFLPDDWSPASLRDTSFLLHELVHHMQSYSANDYACIGEREAEAYDTQFAWLKAANVDDPVAFIQTNELYLLFVTQCRPHAR